MEKAHEFGLMEIGTQANLRMASRKERAPLKVQQKAGFTMDVGYTDACSERERWFGQKASGTAVTGRMVFGKAMAASLGPTDLPTKASSERIALRAGGERSCQMVLGSKVIFMMVNWKAMELSIGPMELSSKVFGIAARSLVQVATVSRMTR
jgi:hypothetical protein